MHTVEPTLSGPKHSVTAFLGHQREVLSETDFRAAGLAETVDLVDGRLILVHPGPWLASQVSNPRAPVARKRGDGARPADRSRFALVMRFLATWQLELLKNGLARGHEPMAVREEFINFLLNYELDARQTEIPRTALRCFLDEWSHRWI